jgi:uncharacterized protein with PIN domain
MRFAVDKMLGRLAKWLRILGYDTLFDPYVSSAAIAKQAQEENRIFLTRDVKLTKNSDPLSFYIVQSENYRTQLREVVGHFNLDIPQTSLRVALSATRRFFRSRRRW